MSQVILVQPPRSFPLDGRNIMVTRFARVCRAHGSLSSEMQWSHAFSISLSEGTETKNKSMKQTDVTEIEQNDTLYLAYF